MIYRPEWFELHELVPPAIFTARGEAAWELLDSRALMTLDSLREQFGPIIVNNWQSGGQYSESGLRVSTSTTGATYSQHRYGRAFDCKLSQTTPKAASAYILEHHDQFQHLTTLEDVEATPTWLHFDVRLNAIDEIRIVKP